MPNAICSCPMCKWERDMPRVSFIPVGVELLEMLEAHPSLWPIDENEMREEVGS